MTRQSMAELAAHLERHGYVELVPDAADRGARLVRPTGRGRAVHAEARAFMAEVEARRAAALGDRGLGDLRRLLERIQPGSAKALRPVISRPAMRAWTASSNEAAPASVLSAAYAPT